MNQEEKPFAKLFNSIELKDEEHLDLVLKTMNKDNSIFIMIQALKYAYHSGIYSMGEVEILSKCIREISKKDSN